MNWFCKHVGLLLLATCLIGNLYADDSVFIGDGDIGALKLYDSQGNRLDATSENASQIGEGWILHNPDTPILIITPRGTINVYEGSLLITGNLTSKAADLYLVSGKATFNTTDMEGGELTVSTPVSRHRLQGDGEMLVISTNDEESVTSFSGTVESYNALTGFTRTIRPFDKLFMQEQSARPRQIEVGYYLTYATYPDMMLARQVVQELSTPIIAPTPGLPKARTTEMVVELPVMQEVKRTPIAAAVSSLTITEQKPFIPEKVQVISVQVQKVAIPEKVKRITSTILKAPSSRIIVTVRPMVPEVPRVLTSSTTVQIPAPLKLLTNRAEEVAVEVLSVPEEPITETVPVIEMVEALPSVEESQPAIVVEPAMETPTPPAEQISSPTSATPATSLSTAAPSLLSSSSGADRQQLSFGLVADYRFQFDGTNSNAMSHRITVKPFFTKGPFSLSLQSYLETQDFSSFSTNTMPFPTSTLAKISYAFSYIDQLRIGYSTSAFYLALDHNRSLVSDMASFTAPQFTESGKLVLQSQIKAGPFTLISAFDDLYLTNLLNNRSQFASTFLQFTPSSGYPLTIALGSLAEVQNTPSWSVDLYPLLSFRFPIINTRTTRFSAILQAHGYLPIYPTIDTDQFIDTSLATFFPNYSLGAGFSVKRNNFSAKLLASLNQGKNHNLLVNDFAYTTIDTSYASAFDILFDIRYEGSRFETKVVWNVPLTGSFAIASLTSGQNADYSQLSMGLRSKKMTFGFGLSKLGLLDTLQAVINGTDTIAALIGGTYAASYLYASYEFGMFSLMAKAAYPASSTAFTIPVVSLNAKIKLSKTL